MANDIHVTRLNSAGNFTGSILRVQAIGPAPISGGIHNHPGTSSLSRLAFGDLKATSEITTKMDLPNGSVIEGPIHSLEWSTGDFLIIHKSQHIPVV